MVTQPQRLVKGSGGDRKQQWARQQGKNRRALPRARSRCTEAVDKQHYWPTVAGCSQGAEGSVIT